MKITSLLSSLFRPRADVNGTWTSMDGRGGFSYVGTPIASSGERVTEATSMALAAYYACIRVISEDVAKLPFPVYERLQPRGRNKLTDHPTTVMLNVQPNPSMDSMAFRETMTHHVLGWGNAYSLISRGPFGDAESLGPPIPPPLVRPYWFDDAKSEIRYEVQTAPDRKDTYRAENVLHIHGLGFDGIQGYSIARIGRESLGGALAAQTFGGSFFGNGARPGGVLTHPSRMKEESEKRLRAAWEAVYGGSTNAGKVAILEDGMTYTPISVPPEDAQFIETGHFKVEEVCRWFRVSPHKVQHLLRATFSNIEMQSIEHVTDTLMPWLTRWEKPVKIKLIAPRDTALYAEHDVNGLLRGDIRARFDAYSKARQWGWMSANDVLELENRNPIGPEGDIYMIPANMMDARSVAQESAEDARSSSDAATDLLVADVHRNQRLDALAEAHHPILCDVYTRLLRVESDKAARAEKRGTLESWASKFYAEHQLHAVSEFSRPVEAYCAASIGATMTDATEAAILQHLRGMASRHCEASMSTIEDRGGWMDRPSVAATDELSGLSSLMRELSQ